MTTIIFVPGGWHLTKPYEGVANILENCEYSTEVVSLPSHNPSPEVLDKGYWPDAAAVREVIIKAVDAGQKVVLFMHSNAGTFGPEAAYELDWNTRQAKGLPGGVIHLIFCAARFFNAGQSSMDTGDGVFPDWMVMSDDGLTIKVKDAKNVFYHDCEPEVAEEMEALLVPQASTVFTTTIVHDTWKVIPSTYIITMNDRTAMTPAIQEYFIDTIAKDCKFNVVKMETGHSPFLAKPEETAAVIRKAAELPINSLR